MKSKDVVKHGTTNIAMDLNIPWLWPSFRSVSTFREPYPMSCFDTHTDRTVLIHASHRLDVSFEQIKRSQT
jgi:hypothetical protein